MQLDGAGFAGVDQLAVRDALYAETSRRRRDQGDTATGRHQQHDREDLLDPLLDAGMLVGEEAHGQLVEVASLRGGVADDLFVGEVRWRQRPPDRRQPMISRYYGVQRLTEHDPRIEHHRIERRAAQAQIQLAAQQAVDLRRGDPLVQDHVDARQFL